MLPTSHQTCFQESRSHHHIHDIVSNLPCSHCYALHAERSNDYTVDWKQYRGCGGANEILGSKFDDWWEAHWKELFGAKNEGDTAKFSVNNKAKADGIRYAMLVYELDNGKRTNYEIAQEILKNNKTTSVLDAFVGEKDVVQSRIGRYKRTAHLYLGNVYEGRLV